MHHEEQVLVLEPVAKVEESLIASVEFVIKNHSGKLQRANYANIAIACGKLEAVSRNQVVDCIEKVCLVIVVLSLCHVVVAMVEWVSEKLEIYQLSCFQMIQATETWIVSYASTDLTIESSTWNDCRFVHHHMHEAS